MVCEYLWTLHIIIVLCQRWKENDMLSRARTHASEYRMWTTWPTQPGSQGHLTSCKSSGLRAAAAFVITLTKSRFPTAADLCKQVWPFSPVLLRLAFAEIRTSATPVWPWMQARCRGVNWVASVACGRMQKVFQTFLAYFAFTWNWRVFEPTTLSS